MALPRRDADQERELRDQYEASYAAMRELTQDPEVKAAVESWVRDEDADPMTKAQFLGRYLGAT